MLKGWLTSKLDATPSHDYWMSASNSSYAAAESIIGVGATIRSTSSGQPRISLDQLLLHPLQRRLHINLLIHHFAHSDIERIVDR